MKSHTITVDDLSTAEEKHDFVLRKHKNPKNKEQFSNQLAYFLQEEPLSVQVDGAVNKKPAGVGVEVVLKRPAGVQLTPGIGKKLAADKTADTKSTDLEDPLAID